MNQIMAVVLNQAPDVLAQQLVLERLNCIGWFIVCGVLFTVGLCARERLAAKDHGFDDNLLPNMAVWILLFVSGFGLVSNPVDFVGTFMAPKAAAINAMIQRFK